MRSAQAAKLPPQCRKSLLERTPLSICRAMLFLPTQRGIIGSANTLPGLVCIGDTVFPEILTVLWDGTSEEGGSVKNGGRWTTRRRAFWPALSGAISYCRSAGRLAPAGVRRWAAMPRHRATEAADGFWGRPAGSSADLKSHGRASAASAMLLRRLRISGQQSAWLGRRRWYRSRSLICRRFSTHSAESTSGSSLQTVEEPSRSSCRDRFGLVGVLRHHQRGSRRRFFLDRCAGGQ
jgi:hypothetical protein